MWKSAKILWEKLWNFESSEEDDDDDDDDEESVHSSSSILISCVSCQVPWPVYQHAAHERSCPYRSSSFKSTTDSDLRDDLDAFCCPITGELFVDPVVAEDGHTYERRSIEHWINQNGTSPLTRTPLSITRLHPNRAIKDAMEEFFSRRRTSSQRSSSPPFKYTLNIDVRKECEMPFVQTIGKSVFRASWIVSRPAQSEAIVLLYITGDRAMKEARLNLGLPAHPHILRTFGLVKHADPGVLLVQELARRGNLSDLLHDEIVLPTLPVLRTILVQIVEALIFLAAQGVVHGDLACRNVLVFNYDRNVPARNLVKLTDFGISRQLGVTTQLDVMPFFTTAPEVLRSKSYSEKSDVWAFAVTACEMFSKGVSLFDDQADRHMPHGGRLSRPAECPMTYWQVFVQCLSENPNDRPTFVELKRQLTGL